MVAVSTAGPRAAGPRPSSGARGSRPDSRGRGQDARGSGLASSNAKRTLALVIALVVLAGTVALSIFVGARAISPEVVWESILGSRATEEHIMVLDLRIPRTVVGLVVGPALGLCGALIQAFTRNPLADPGILGVNAGASFVVTLAVGIFGFTAPGQYVWFALIGAFLATMLVYAMGSVGGGTATPLTLTLAGVAISAVLGGFTSAIVLKNIDALNVTRFWGVGSIGGRSMDVLLTCLPLILIGVVLALFCARSLNALSLGDELAASLGVRIRSTRVLVVIAVTLLAGTAVAIAGPIGFVGLMVPHVVRWFVGPDQRWILVMSIVISPILLLAADILGRIVLPSGELRVGLVTAIVGAPVLIGLVRRKKVSGL
ncbi:MULTISPECIES: FecCD family ABC transporter permease [unclassified Pseudoclavibacter]|uniref:FecCD family ABC transporter permease n=1 Tax=unclassified Pseudoclavibacter TaxID=2615177 RepID=UPI001BAB7C2E|nr:iron chelate uptake ABC transporter family permease subunit [Pseudoclavibacter sp. Marseille-Q4354]MBS3178838.1 iron chelate uptake ABC transporter family permease subunit [Pseudoclavibacter sp. Marseille-Q4354]